MKTQDFKQLIEDVYFEVLAEQAVLKTSSQETLGKFPTLKRTLVDLLTTEYDQFVSDVKWVAPKPSTFEIILQNGERFFLKWSGKNFIIQVAGKSYDLGLVSEYQQALNRVNELLKTGPVKTSADMEAEEEEDAAGFGGDDFGADDFGGADALSDEPVDNEVDFEEPEEEPDFDL